MSLNKQLINNIKRQISRYDYEEVAKSRCKNEAQTRILLIEPFISDVLGYDILNEVTPEYNADFGDRVSKKVDYAISIHKNKPIILIEAKKYGEKLSDKHAGQLNNYFVNTDSAKIGILTNGIEYRFYVTSTYKQNILTPEPFLIFQIIDFSNSDLEVLSKFHKKVIEPTELIEETDEKIFVGMFEEALCSELTNPTDDFLKCILKRMNDSYRLTSQRKEQLIELLNPFSIKGVADRIYEKQNSGDTGIITTAEEKQAFHFIKAVLMQHRNIDPGRISYKDYKGFFTVITDDKSRNQICNLKLGGGKKTITINDVTYELNSLDEITNYKKQLTEVTLGLLDS
tara:strand:- start:988 stop:2013 length:1026 start_codon:yes stop_codon:yes gene_type:complete